MRSFSTLLWMVLFGCLLAGPARAQAGAAPGGDPSQPASNMVLVLPFNNASGQAALDWMGESFVESLDDTLQSAGLMVLSRSERASAFDQAGIPLLPTLSRGTLIRIAENIDVRWLITGSYSYTNNVLHAHAEVLDLQSEHLTPLLEQTGALADLGKIQDRMAWSVRAQVDPAYSSAPPVSEGENLLLPAYESYIRGVVATDPDVQLKFFRQAVRLQPSYGRAIYRLGEWYYENHNKAEALAWLTHVPASDSHFAEAQFAAGLAALSLGKNEEAARLFSALSMRLPLTEVLNNLGLAELRQGNARAVIELDRAAHQSDADIPPKANLAAWYCNHGEVASAVTWLRAALAHNEDATLAAALHGLVNKTASCPNPALAAQMERAERTFPADQFRQFEATLVAFNAVRASRLTPERQERFHLQQAESFLKRGALDAAVAEFHAALKSDAADSEAHGGLAYIYAQRQDWSKARLHASAALQAGAPAVARIHAHLALAHADLAMQQPDAAAKELGEVLALDPSNLEAEQLQARLKQSAATVAPGQKAKQ